MIDHPTEPVVVELGAVTLRRQGMPTDEVRAVVRACDPEVVRRHLGLHRERLGERLAEERRLTARLEESLVRRLRR